MLRHRLPLLPVLIAIITGIVVVRYIHITYTIELTCIVFATICFFRRAVYPLILTLACLAGCLSYNLSQPEYPDQIVENKECYWLATIKKTGYYNSGQRLVIDIDSVYTEDKGYDVKNCNAYLYLNEFDTPFEAFQKIFFKGKLTPLKFDPELPGDYDFTFSSKNNNIIGQFYSNTASVTAIRNVNSIYKWSYNLRLNCEDLIEHSGVSTDCGEFLNAILMGDSKGLSTNQREIYVSAGVAHILALSGTHVAIIGTLIFILLMPLRRIGLRNTVYLTVIAGLWFYAMLTGLSPSVSRSVIMITIIYLAKMTGRRSNGLNALFFAAIAILLFSPNSLFMPSFQLSFCAVGSLLVFGKYIIRLRMSHKIAGYFIYGSLSTIAALLGTALIAAYHFHQFPVYSVLANFPAAILLPILITCGIVIMLTGSIIVPPTLVIGFTDRCHEMLMTACSFFANCPNAVIENITVEPIIFLPYLFFLIFLYLIFTSKRKFMYVAASIITLILCVPFIRITSQSIDSALYIYGNSRDTEIIACSKGLSMHLSVHQPVSDYTKLKSLERRHPNFLVIHGSTKFCSTQDINSSHQISFSNQILKIGDINTAIVNSLEDLIDFSTLLPIDYCLICCGFDDKAFSQFISRTAIGKIILPRELHINQIRRYIEFCEKNGIEYISLRESKFWLNF